MTPMTDAIKNALQENGFSLEPTEDPQAVAELIALIRESHGPGIDAEHENDCGIPLDIFCLHHPSGIDAVWDQFVGTEPVIESDDLADKYLAFARKWELITEDDD